ncbi:hypothetical protein EVAR_85896_1 [Eumeta japonica]|uniref:Endonuclease/exonuclease/phosphatase domain-containing protein n=1 Tax=Eumeta variegata TaxID=151549 RepID=A0A4C2A2G7_EUMVA|nr:hypothetical protein EVAR_85896_1 [Eumeta japonica]
MPRFWHTKAVCGEKLRHVVIARTKLMNGKNARRKQNEEPKCKNCWENGIKTEANHEAFSNKCKVRQKWDEIARSRIAIAKGNDMETGDAPTEVDKNDSDDSSESPEIQSSDCRVTQLATEKGISIALVQEPYVGNQGILKQNPGTKNEAGIISIYFEGDEDIEPYHQNEKACKNLGTENLIIAGDINAWSHWWGSQREDRGQAYRDFLDEMAHILNTGSTPTFETYRGDRICSSIVDVTACSSPLIGPIKPMEPITTRRYNTNKADWTEFCLQLRNTLQKYGLPKGQRKTKRIPLVDSGTKRSKKTSCAKEENPQRSPHEKKAVIEDYLTAKTIYTQKAEIAQTESWKEYCTTQDKESMGQSIQSNKE